MIFSIVKEDVLVEVRFYTPWSVRPSHYIVNFNLSIMLYHYIYTMSTESLYVSFSSLVKVRGSCWNTREMCWQYQQGVCWLTHWRVCHRSQQEFHSYMGDSRVKKILIMIFYSYMLLSMKETIWITLPIASQPQCCTGGRRSLEASTVWKPTTLLSPFITKKPDTPWWCHKRP